MKQKGNNETSFSRICKLRRLILLKQELRNQKDYEYHKLVGLC